MMKRATRNILTCILLALSVLCLVLAGCGSKGVKFKFETNGADPIDAIEAKAGDEVELPTPEWEGHSFEGWYENAELSGSPVTKFTAEKSKTFYAKWEQLYEVTLSVGGGTLAEHPKIWLKAGANLAEAVKDYVPTYADHTFGEWLMNGTALQESAVMPAANVTLTAHYKVKYTVHVWLQNVAQNGYEAGEDITGYDYPAQDYTPEVTVHGFEVATHEGENKTHALTDTVAQNDYTFYMNRKTIALTLRTNYPDGKEDATKSISYVFGQEVDLPDPMHTDEAFPLETEGYLFVGWAKSITGSVEYASQWLQGQFQNVSAEAERDSFAVDAERLYAVWAEGAKDIFGGEDLIFHTETDAEHVVMLRQGDYYRGSYRANSKSFTFDLGGEKTLQGKFYDGTYAYYNENRQGQYLEYTSQNGVDTTRSITLGFYNEITFTVHSSMSATASEGSYTFDDDGNLVAFFDEGELAGVTWTMMLGYVTNSSSGTSTRVFLVRNEEEYEYGPLMLCSVSGGKLGYYSAILTMDGFGNANIVSQSISGTISQTNYIYVSRGDIISLYTTSNRSLYGTFKHLTIDGNEYFAVYESSIDNTFTAANGETLTLDGTFNATYTAGSTVIDGYYEAAESVFGGYIITLTEENGTQHLFRIYTGTREVTDPGTGRPTTQRTYLLEVKDQAYKEYIYNNEENNYRSPLLVIEDAKNASLYGYTRQGVYVKVAEGEYSYSATTGNYTFTVKTPIATEEDLFREPIDVTLVESFVYSVGVASGMDVTYWHSVTYREEEPTNFEKKYTNADGGTLYLVGGFAIYKAADAAESVTSVFTEVNGYENTIRITVGESYVYFELTEGAEGAAGTYAILEKLLGGATERLADGTSNRSVTFTFDGKGGATLTTAQSEGDPVVVEGSYEETDATKFETKVYHFTPKDGTDGFDFILLSSSSATYFARFNRDVALELTSAEDGGKLTLDGYSYMAEYTLPEGEAEEGEGVIRGLYAVNGDAIELTVPLTNGSSVILYFDLDESDHTKFTLRGGEAGTYLRFDNQYMNGISYALDGHGHVTVSKYDLDAEELQEPTVIDENGTYTYDEATEQYTIKYHDGGDEIIVVGILGTYPISNTQSLRIFIIEQKEAFLRKYVNKADWTVFIPDSIGNAVRYTELGVRERGTYVIIEETDGKGLLYYVNSAGTDACLYRYDTSLGTVEKIVYKERGYYTQDLRSLRFTPYGFMIMDGETRYYYTVDGDGKITTYLLDPENTAANEFGYVVGELGSFEKTITIEGTIYYNNNDGYAIHFYRDTASQDDFPLKDEEGNVVRGTLGELTFTPTGAAEFRVRGTVEIEGEAVVCTVVRANTSAEGEEAVYELYVLIENDRYYIDVAYTGDTQNSYAVSALSNYISVYNNNFYQDYYLLYALLQLFGGSTSILNSLDPTQYGTLTIICEYDKDGMPADPYIDAELSAGALVLEDGTVVTSLKHVPYEFDEETNYYIADYQGADGENYKFYFGILPNSAFGVYAYNLFACTKTQTLTDGIYKVEVERVVATDYQSVSRGGIWTIKLFENGQEIELEDDSFFVLGKFYAITRTRQHLSTDAEGVDTGKITGTTYYIITLTEATVEETPAPGGDEETEETPGGETEEGGEQTPATPQPIAPYESVTVEKHEMKTVYFLVNGTESPFYFVDIYKDDNDKGVAFYYYGGSWHFAESCTYDEATKTYTATLYNEGMQVRITISTTEEGREQATLTTVQTSNP